MGGAGPVSAADMMTFLSAQQHIKAETVETDKCAPATSPEARDTEGSEDFCCILCGFKESSVDKLKDHINMHFIGQVKKRKSENDGVSEEESQGQNKVKEATVKKVKLETQVAETESSLEMESETDPLALESPGSGAGGIPVSGGGSQVSVKTGNGLVVTGTKTGTKSSLPTVTKSSLTCTNCDISFVNPSTYNAHVQFYCKNKEGSH